MAVVATLSKGYDLDYIWKQVDRGPARDAASYYIQASESGGEPPGRWWGPGARALGFEPGQRVERGPYDLLFGERKAPDGTQLGRPPGNGRKAADLYARLLAAEPHATVERAANCASKPPGRPVKARCSSTKPVSLSKSTSLFHASLGENARLARQAGDQDGDQYWSALVGEVDDMIWQAVHAGFGYSQHLEEALTARFGLEWTARDDGHGFEIKGVTGEMMRLFSSRRASITADVRGRAAQFEQRYGRKPSQRELARLAQASNFKTRAAKQGALDFAQLHAGWADKLARTLGVSLASVAPSVWHGGTAGTHAGDPRGPGPASISELELSQAAQKAVALAQQEKSAWTRADLVKYLGRVLPRSGMEPAAAAACWRTWLNGRCGRSSSRWRAWKRRSPGTVVLLGQHGIQLGAQGGLNRSAGGDASMARSSRRR